MSENETQRRKGTPLTNGVKHNMGYGTGSGASGTVGCDQATHVLHVDKKRTDTYTPNGSLARPYKIVQDALNRAMELMVPNSDPFVDLGVAINVLPGHYDEICNFVFPRKYRNLGIQGAGQRGEVSLNSLTIQSSGESISHQPETPWSQANNELHVSRLRLGSRGNENPISALDLICPSGARLDAFCWECHFWSYQAQVPILRATKQTGGEKLYLHLCNANWLHRQYETAGDAPAVLLDGAHFDFEAGRMENRAYADLIQSNGGNLDIQNSILDSSHGRPMYLTGGSQAVMSGVKFLSPESDAIRHDGLLGDNGFVLLNGVMFALTTGLAVNAPSGAAVLLAPTSWDGYFAGGAGIESKIVVADPALLKRLQTAAVTGYAPTQTANWNTTPADIKAALDELASRVKALEA